jgi:hypothetical protein
MAKQGVVVPWSVAVDPEAVPGACPCAIDVGGRSFRTRWAVARRLFPAWLESSKDSKPTDGAEAEGEADGPGPAVSVEALGEKARENADKPRAACKDAESVAVFLDRDCGEAPFRVILNFLRREAERAEASSATLAVLAAADGNDSDDGEEQLSLRARRIDAGDLRESLADLDSKDLRALQREARYLGQGELLDAVQRALAKRDGDQTAPAGADVGIEALVSRTRRDMNEALRLLEHTHRLRLVLQDEIEALQQDRSKRGALASDDQSGESSALATAEDECVRLRLELERERQARLDDAAAARQRYDRLKIELTGMEEEVLRWQQVAERSLKKDKKSKAGGEDSKSPRKNKGGK